MKRGGNHDRLRKAAGRTPQGERGLKPGCEIAERTALSRSPQGERGLKRVAVRERRQDGSGRSPQGERGLKPEKVLTIV